MTQPQAPETGLIEKAMKKVDEGKKQAIDGYNKLVAAANKFLEYAAILSPLIAAIAMRYIRNGLKALADALKKIIEWIDTTISRQVPILSLIITAFDWLNHAKMPLSEVNFKFKEARSPDFVKWSGAAQAAYTKKTQIQQDAVVEAQNRSDFISAWLYKIVTSNVNFAAAIADVVATVVGKIIQAVIDCEDVINIPWAIDTVASMVGGLVADGIKLLTKEVQRVFEEIGALRDLTAIISDHSRLPGGKWPEAVVG